MHKHDTPERRRLALMRAATTKATKDYTLSGKRRQKTRPAPSLATLPWDHTETKGTQK